MASEVAAKPSSPSLAEIISSRRALLVLIALIAFGFAVRWIGVGEQSLTHPEAYIPGIDLSTETRVPPPRHEFWETLRWHFHDEPHPVGYYMAMFAWTSVFGDSETALRAPSVLFGVGSIFLVYGLGATLYGRAVGLAAAALLAFNGFHIFWSGIARMYAPGAFFGLLATFLLVKIVTKDRIGPALGAGYVLSVVAAVQTTELNWAIFGAHVLWAAWLAAERSSKIVSRESSQIVVLQAVAFFLAAPALLHAVYTARSGAADAPSPAFALHYFTFGFLLEPDQLANPVRAVNGVVVAAAFLLSLALVAVGMKQRAAATPAPVAGPIPVEAMAALALASAGFMFWLSTVAEQRGATLAVISLLPILALAWPVVAGGLRVGVRRAAQPVEALIGRIDPFMLLIAGLGVLAPFAIIILSLWKPVTESRPFIVFIPYLLILVGAGLAALWPRRPLFIAASVAVAALLAVSVGHSKNRVTSPRDYKGLAAAIEARGEEADLIFIRRWEWRDAPITYYLPHAGIVGENFAERIGSSDARRVWTIEWFDDEDSTADRLAAAALAGFVVCERAEARGGVATLHVLGGGEGCSD